MSEESIAKVRRRLAEARRVAVITGAGVSAESGVPTFRGKEGLWRNFDPMQLATPEAFARDPKLVWEWYDWRRGLISRCQPGAAHQALVQIEQQIPDFLLVTQNVDGLHEQAGSRNIVRLHGSIWRILCTKCPCEREDRQVPLDPLPPMCEHCGALMRPGVVWFGEYLPPEPIERTERFFTEAPPEIVLVVGTSALFPYIQNWAYHGRHSGGLLVEVSPEPTPISEIADVILQGKAGEILPRLVNA